MHPLPFCICVQALGLTERRKSICKQAARNKYTVNISDVPFCRCTFFLFIVNLMHYNVYVHIMYETIHVAYFYWDGVCKKLQQWACLIFRNKLIHLSIWIAPITVAFRDVIWKMTVCRPWSDCINVQALVAKPLAGQKLNCRSDSYEIYLLHCRI